MRTLIVICAVVSVAALSGAGPAQGASLNVATKKVTKTKNPATHKPTTKRPASKKTATLTSTTTVPVAAVGAPQPITALPVVLASFGTCGASTVGTGVDCANVPAPLDPTNPTGEQISLFVSRHRAANPGTRIGVLFVNPGGPGGPTLDVVRTAKTFLTPEVLDRFDIIGVDPRGTERSAPLTCSLNSVAQQDLISPTDNSTVERLKAQYANLGKACASTDGKLLNFMDTTTAARDIDAVRIALGEQKISFVGLSYGTYLGAVYESLFPEHSRSIVLDSAIDPTRFGVNQLLDPLAQSELALDGFLTACATGVLTPCRFNDGTDLFAKYAQFRERYLGSTANRDRTESRFDALIQSLVGYPRNGWPILGRALQELADGKAANFNPTAADNQTGDARENISQLDTFSVATNIAINCRDGILPRDPSAYQYVVDNVSVVAPRFSGIRFNEGVTNTCISWPSPPAVLTPLRAGVATTLVIANVFDPKTPIAWSRSLATQLGSALLIRNGGGHVAVDKSACVREAVARFLIDNVIPAAGTICSPDLANPS